MATEENTVETVDDHAQEKLETTMVSMENLENGMTDTVQQEEETTDVVEQEVVEKTKKETTVDKTVEEKENVVEQNEVPTLEYSDDKVLEYLKGKGIDVSDFESLKTPKEINSYEDLLDAEDKAYLNYKKDTGKQISRKDYNDIVTKDFTKVSAVELAKERVIKDSGINLSNEEVLEYLEEELGFDPNAEDLTARERIKLASFVKDIREQKINEQKTILDRLPDLKAIDKEYDSKEYVKLDNGAIVKKEAFEASQAKRNEFIKLNKEAISRATDFDFNMTVDDNGKERQLSYSTKLEPKDLQRLESITTDVFSHLEKTYKKGDSYDVDSLNKNMAWADEQIRDKMLDNFAHQIRANAIEEVMKEGGNINLDPKKHLDQQKDRGVKIIPISEL
tara:strand:- start:11901 stop:13076 length:1176 start_codon:yes stop_codon:yes gene_type:complete